MSQPTSVVLPARVTVQCPECGSSQTELALHHEALAQACRCPDCDATREVVATWPFSVGCSCC